MEITLTWEMILSSALGSSLIILLIKTGLDARKEKIREQHKHMEELKGRLGAIDKEHLSVLETHVRTLSENCKKDQVDKLVADLHPWMNRMEKRTGEVLDRVARVEEQTKFALGLKQDIDRHVANHVIHVPHAKLHT